MSVPKISTDNLTHSPVLEELLGNARIGADRKTARASVSSFALQLLAQPPFNAFLGAVGGGMKGYPTEAELLGVTEPETGTLALVYADPNSQKNGTYRKTVASGLSGWTLLPELAQKFYVLNNANAGTANAIVATASSFLSPASAGTIFVLPITADTTASNVTLAINGNPARPIVTNLGNALPVGYLKADMVVLLRDDGVGLRLLTDGDIAALVLAAENAAAQAEDAKNQVQALLESITQRRFASKAAAEAFSPTIAPEELDLTGFAPGVKFGFVKTYIKTATEPTHGGKITLTLQDTSKAYYVPSVMGIVTPAMYGGSIFDALQRGVRVELLDNYMVTEGMTVNNPSLLEVKCIGASITLDPSVTDINTMFRFQNQPQLHWHGQIKINANQKVATGIAIEVADGGTNILVSGFEGEGYRLKVAGSYGAGNVYIYAPTGTYERGEIVNCRAVGIARDINTGGATYCQAHVIQDAKFMRMALNYTKGVSRSGFAGDADAYVVFSENVGGIYSVAHVIIEHNVAIDFEGRAIKTQVRGTGYISYNQMRIETAISLMAGWMAIDEQIDGLFTTENEIHVVANFTKVSTASCFVQRIPILAPVTPWQHIGGTIGRNKVYTLSTAPKFTYIVFITLAGGASQLYNGAFTVSNVEAMSEQGIRGAAIADYAIGIDIPDLAPATAGRASVCMLYNKIAASEMGFRPGFASSAPAHGAAGDMTGKLELEIVGNTVPIASDIPALAWGASRAITSSFICRDNNIGTRGNRVEMPFDAIKLPKGNHFNVGSAPALAHANVPTPDFASGIYNSSVHHDGSQIRILTDEWTYFSSRWPNELATLVWKYTRPATTAN